MNPRVKPTREQILRLLDGHPVQLATPVGLLELEAQPDDVWTPLKPVEIAPHARRLYEATMGEKPVEVWENDLYAVIVRRIGEGGDDPTQDSDHLSIKRHDRAAIHNWRHFQQIKNEICGENREGFELYPREDRLVDNANQYHLWVLPAGMDVPVGFSSGMVVRDDDDVAEYNSMTPSGRQEPYQEGLTTGESINAVAKEAGTTNAAMDALRSLQDKGFVPRA